MRIKKYSNCIVNDASGLQKGRLCILLTTALVFGTALKTACVLILLSNKTINSRCIKLSEGILRNHD